MRIIDYREAAAIAPAFSDHEQVSLIQDEETGLQALIAIHNTKLGPAVGGCRMYPYQSLEEALHDVLRLSKGMTYKSAVAGLPMGGGKAVIIGDPHAEKTPELLEKMGEFVNAHDGRYVTAEDSGMSVADLKVMRRKTKFVLGVSDDQEYGGDPSPLTALGIFVGIESAVKHKLNQANLQGIKVALQGAGSVGFHLTKQLIAAGATVYACDINEANSQRVASIGANIVPTQDIFSLEVDVFCPCAMGGVLNDETISVLKAPIVAGGANNQLEFPHHADALQNAGILYAPDYVINAGGIIEICRQLKDEPSALAHSKISEIAKTLTNIFSLSDSTGQTTSKVADGLAEQRFAQTDDKSQAA